MTSIAPLKFFLAGAAVFLACFAARADDTNVINSATNNAEGRITEAAIINNQAALRASLELQEQMRKTQLAIEQNRVEAEAAAARNAELIDKLFNSHRVDEMNEMRRSNQMMLIASGAFAGFGFLVLLFAAMLQWTTVNRINALAARLPQGLALEAGLSPAALAIGDAPVGPGPAVQHASGHFLSLVERLEKRLADMENGQHKALEEGAFAHVEANSQTAEESSQATLLLAESMKTVTLLLSKGQTLLKLDQPEDALHCFDEALGLDPGSVEALLKKGAALERLQRLDEAIHCYDLAIARDNSITMAYLYKGGVFNRLERYDEALECYEQALKTQEKGRPVGVGMIAE